jgi:hypothetical protein
MFMGRNAVKVVFWDLLGTPACAEALVFLAIALPPFAMAHGSIGAHDNFLPNIIQTACQVIRLPEFGPSSWQTVGQVIYINEPSF